MGYYLFNGKEHETFVIEMLERTKCKKDIYRISLFYTLGIIQDLRDNINTLYDFETNEIKFTGLEKGFQTSQSIKLCYLAFNLYNGYFGEKTDTEIHGKYTPYELFDCPYLPFMLEAIKIRYAEHMDIE